MTEKPKGPFTLEQIRKRGHPIEYAWYVNYNVMSSQYLNCRGPMTHEAAERFVREWRATDNPCGCFLGRYQSRYLFNGDVYVFEPVERIFVYERPAKDADKETAKQIGVSPWNVPEKYDWTGFSDTTTTELIPTKDMRPSSFRDLIDRAASDNAVAAPPVPNSSPTVPYRELVDRPKSSIKKREHKKRPKKSLTTRVVPGGARLSGIEKMPETFVVGNGRGGATTLLDFSTNGGRIDRVTVGPGQSLFMNF
jgi:hypothetical protein